MIKLFTFILLALPVLTYSQQDSHRMSEQERISMPSYLQQIQLNKPAGFTTPPVYPVRASAEWEEIDALMITWTGYQAILKDIVRYSQTETQVIIICSDSNAVKSYLTTNSVPLVNLHYLIAPFNTIWCRDYGQWNIYTNDVDSLALIDWIYNRPRPADDTIPSSIQRYTNLPMYQTITAPNNLIHTGGNFMTDGLGTGFSSNLILDENPTKTEAEVDTIMKNFMGINRYIKMTDLPYDQIHHIDMHIKLLDEETLLVGEYPPGVADGPQIEANLQYILNNFSSPFGTPYKVIRIPMPPGPTGTYPNQNGDYRTYANAVFVNRTIILPTYDPQYDSTAIRIWQEAMPGYTIAGINCNSIIPSLGAIHCITKEVSSNNPLLIVHQPLHDTYVTTGTYVVDARIQHRSGISNASIYFRTDTTQPYQAAAMTFTGPSTNTWTGFIPAQAVNSTVYYFIQAQSVSGKLQVRPLPAPAGYWKFNVLLNTGIKPLASSHTIELENIFPNPSKGITCIPVLTDHPVQAEIVLKNILGQNIENIFSGTIDGGRKFFINTSALPAGVYFVELSCAENKMESKLIVR